MDIKRTMKRIYKRNIPHLLLALIIGFSFVRPVNAYDDYGVYNTVMRKENERIRREALEAAAPYLYVAAAGAFLMIIGVIRYYRSLKQCPHCKEYVNNKATICKHCKTTLNSDEG